MANDALARQLDVTARSIELVTTAATSPFIDIVASITQTGSGAATEIIKWLARERLPQDAFIYTMSLGQSLAAPNSNGQLVLKQLETTASRLYGLQLVIPGALGRNILADPKLRWVGTTEAVILKYHRVDYTAEVLSDLFVSTKIAHGDSRRTIAMARVRPVIDKIVDSIHLHTVNMGQGVAQLPGFVDSASKHYLAPFILAEAIVAIQQLSGKNIVVQMEVFVIDLFCWIYHHWPGKIVVGISNNIVFEEILGDSIEILTILVIKSCAAQDDCHHPEHVGSIEIGECIDFMNPAHPKYEKRYVGITDPAAGMSQESAYRAPFYDIRNPFRTRECRLNQKEEKTAQRAAQDIVRSIVALPVLAAENSDQPSLSVDNSSQTRFQWWLKKTPTLLQKNLGGGNSTRSLHIPAEDEDEEMLEGEDSSDGGSEHSDLDYTTAKIAHWYPEIAAALQLAHQRCECGCSKSHFETAITNPLDEGCLVTLMFTEIILFVGHAMTEAAGGSDISSLKGIESSQSLVEAVVAFLGTVASRGEISWNTWFRLSSCAVTGTPYDLGEDVRTADVGGGIFLWVAGSMTIVPIWFNLSEAIKLEGSWGIRQLTGSLQGLEAEIAVVETQESNVAEDTSVPDIQFVEGGGDAEEVHAEGVVFSSKGDLYRHMTVVRTSKCIRALNPLRIYRGAMLARRPTCNHLSEALGANVHPWTLNDVIKCWNSWKTPDGDGPHVALLEDSPVKQNVAIGFSTRCVVQTGQCCFPCLAQSAKNHNLCGVWCGIGERRKQIQRFR